MLPIDTESLELLKHVETYGALCYYGQVDHEIMLDMKQLMGELNAIKKSEKDSFIKHCCLKSKEIKYEDEQDKKREFRYHLRCMKDFI